MDLKEFVKTTLDELSEAINESNASINHSRKIKLTNTSLQSKNTGDYGLIEFDLVVEARVTKEKGAKGIAKIAVAEANFGKTKENSSSTTSRIKFIIEADI